MGDGTYECAIPAMWTGRKLCRWRKKPVGRWSTMTEQIMTLEALRGQSLEVLLQQVVDQCMTVTVLLPDGTEVVIEPKPRLKPLPVLDGHVPAGWKDAVYGRD
jgi:hypothetical protein